MTTVIWAIILGGLLSIVYGAWTIRSVMAADAGNARMQEIAASIQEGAQAYLKRQDMTIAAVGAVILILLGISALGWLVLLQKKGFTRVWPLAGGIQAWRAITTQSGERAQAFVGPQVAA